MGRWRPGTLERLLPELEPPELHLQRDALGLLHVSRA